MSDTNPITLAREVLDHALAVSCAQQAIDTGDGEPEDYRSLTESTERLAELAPDLARAVLAVATALDGLERETDAWENASRAIYGGGLGSDESAINCARETENRIRAALNGGDAA